MPPITDHAQRRERIVNAACQVLATAGLDGFSMRRIAKAAGCTTGMVTHYFSSKRALVGAALDHIRRDHDDRARARLAADPSDPAAALAELLPLDPERANSLRVWLGFYAAAVADATLRRQHARIYANWRAVLAETLDQSGVTGTDHEELVDHLVVALNGLVVQALLDPEHWTAARQRRELRRLVAEALPRDEPG